MSSGELLTCPSGGLKSYPLISSSFPNVLVFLWLSFQIFGFILACVHLSRVTELNILGYIWRLEYERCILTKRKSGKKARRPAWRNEELLDKLQHQKEAYRGRKDRKNTGKLSEQAGIRLAKLKPSAPAPLPKSQEATAGTGG